MFALRVKELQPNFPGLNGTITYSSQQQKSPLPPPSIASYINALTPPTALVLKRGSSASPPPSSTTNASRSSTNYSRQLVELANFYGKVEKPPKQAELTNTTELPMSYQYLLKRLNRAKTLIGHEAFETNILKSNTLINSMDFLNQFTKLSK